MHLGDYYSSSSLRLLLLLLVETRVVSPLLNGGQALTPAELETFRTAFLTKMGLTSTPSAASTSGPIPDYLWEIYTSVRAGRNVENVPEPADSVRNYFPDRTTLDAQGLLHLRFNLSSESPIRDRRLRAEVRVRPDSPRSGRRITLYELVDECHDVRRVLDTRITNDKDGEWLSLDVSSALARTISLQLIVSMTDGNSTDFFTNHSKSSAAIVIYAVDEDKMRSKRSAATEEDEQPMRRWRNGHGPQHEKQDERMGPKSRSRTAPTRPLCQRHPVYVDFAQLNWQDWIVAPGGYDAYYCDGLCSYPLTERQNATNHAIVQSLVHSVSRGAAPAPCCVPTQTDQLSILYIDVDNRIIIKNYPDMRVTACGCR